MEDRGVIKRSHARALLAVLLTVASPAWAKEELIPTKRRSRQRQGPPNPLREVADDMHVVGRRLQEAKTGELTQDKEKTIVEKLDKLIDAARRQQQKQSKGGQGKAQQRQKKRPQPKPASQKKQKQAKKPAAAKKKQQKQSPRPGLGRPGSGKPTGPIHTDAGEWGDLPPAIREQLLQTQGEGFPLKYRELLRRYYRELSKPRE